MKESDPQACAGLIRTEEKRRRRGTKSDEFVPLVYPSLSRASCGKLLLVCSSPTLFSFLRQTCFLVLCLSLTFLTVWKHHIRSFGPLRGFLFYLFLLFFKVLGCDLGEPERTHLTMPLMPSHQYPHLRILSLSPLIASSLSDLGEQIKQQTDKEEGAREGPNRVKLQKKKKKRRRVACNEIHFIFFLNSGLLEQNQFTLLGISSGKLYDR